MIGIEPHRRPPLEASGLGLCYSGHSTVLDDLHFSIASGEFVSLVGPSGCGKTSLLRLVAGLTDPTSGSLTGASDGRCGYVFQEPNLLPWRTVVENIRLPLQLAQVGAGDQQERIDAGLRMVGLHDSDRKKYPRMLSGGMRMRVSLARALVLQPQILLLDEPFAALDDLLRQELNETLLRLWSEQKWTALFVTHNVAEAAYLGQRVMIMGSHPGRLLGEISVPFPYPRNAELRSRSEFASLTGKIGCQLRSLPK